MKTLQIIILILYSDFLLGQKSNLYQIYADDINQQIFIDKKITKIERISYALDTLTGKLKKDNDIIKIEYYPDKKLCKTTNTFYKITSYWKSDTNGYNNFTYDKYGKMQDIEAQDSSPIKIENNKVKMIYGNLLFYNQNNKIIKTITDTMGYPPKYYTECFYSYRHDSLIESKCYSFRYFPNNTNFQDTLTKATSTYSSLGSVATIVETNKTIKKIKYKKDNVDIEEDYINGKLDRKVETYYK